MYLERKTTSPMITTWIRTIPRHPIFMIACVLIATLGGASDVKAQGFPVYACGTNYMFPCFTVGGTGTFRVGDNMDLKIYVQGGKQPYTFAYTGQLPPNLNLVENGSTVYQQYCTLVGTFTQTGSWTATLLLVDGNGNTASTYLTFNVIAAIVPPPAGSSTSIASVTNAAGYGANFSPGSLVSIFGKNLSGSTAQSSGLPLPTTLGGAKVMINNISCPLTYASPTQLNAQVPYEIRPGSATLTIQYGEGASTSITVQAVAPGLFTDPDNQRGAIENSNYSVNSSTNPAATGSLITLYGTGGGPTDVTVGTGQGAPLSPLAHLAGNVVVSINGLAAEVKFAGLAPGYVGLLQVDVIVPDGAGSGDVNIILSVNGVNSNTVVATIAGSSSTPPPSGGGNPVTLVITNDLIYQVNISVNGTVIGGVPASSSAQQTITPGSSLTVSYELVRPLVGGNPVGDPMVGQYQTISNPTGTINVTVNNYIGSQAYFAPVITNQTDATLLLGVNMGLVAQDLCNCTVPASGQNIAAGYYQLFTNSNVRLFPSNTYSGAYTFFGSDPSNPSNSFVSSVAPNTGVLDLTVNTTP